MSRATFLAVLLLLPSLTGAQSLGDVAAKEKERRARQKASGARAYTDEDLKKSGEKQNVNAAPSHGAQQSSDAPEDNRAQETSWRDRARAAREAITQAEQGVKAAEERITALRSDLNPTEGAMNPFRLQSREADVRKAQEELQAAKKRLNDAGKSLEDLEDEARRSRIPPGWLREP